jgi:hypothetical protein
MINTPSTLLSSSIHAIRCPGTKHSKKGISKNMAARVINTSRKHEEACSKALGLKEKPHLQTRSKMKHSGFGIHHGLEKQLKEHR